VNYLMEQTARSAVMVNERLSFEENRTQKSGGAAGDRQRVVELSIGMQAKALRCTGAAKAARKIDGESQP
jgi:hypothetical protein